MGKKRRHLMPPTDRQLEVLRFVARFTDAHGYAPSVRDTMAEFGLKSTKAVVDHFGALRDRGLIQASDQSRTTIATAKGRRSLWPPRLVTDGYVVLRRVDVE